MKAGERLAHAHYRMAELYERWNYAKTPAEALRALEDMQRGIAELSDAIAAASLDVPAFPVGPSRIRRTGRVVHRPERKSTPRYKEIRDPITGETDWVEIKSRGTRRRPGDIPVVSHVRRRPKSVVDRFGHRIRVKEWPSQAGMATLRRHYKRKHPVAWRLSVMKGVRTRQRRREEAG